MTKIATYNPSDSWLARFVRDVRRVLTAAEGGLSWEDNVGPVVTYTALGNATDQAVRLDERPRSVWLVRAVPTTGTGTVTGGAVSWSWSGGTLTVASVSDLDASTTYAVTLGTMTERAND